MEMQRVDSTDIASVGYADGILNIRFHSGGLYRYSNVPLAIYQSLISASSKGKYFHANIKGRYGDTKIG